MKAILFGVLFLFGSLFDVSEVSSLSALRYRAEGLRTAYLDQVVPLRDLRAVSDHYAGLIVQSTSRLGTGASYWSEGARNVDTALAQIGSTWQSHLATTMNRIRAHWSR